MPWSAATLFGETASGRFREMYLEEQLKLGIAPSHVELPHKSPRRSSGEKRRTKAALVRKLAPMPTQVTPPLPNEDDWDDDMDDMYYDDDYEDEKGIFHLTRNPDPAQVCRDIYRSDSPPPLRIAERDITSPNKMPPFWRTNSRAVSTTEQKRLLR
eukprot:gene12414-3646_t